MSWKHNNMEQYMFNVKPIITAATVLLLANGCSSDSSTTSSTPISVIAVSGATVTLDGTYTSGCVDRSLEGGSGYYLDSGTITGSSLNVSAAEYSDAACTVETDSGTLTGTLSVGSTSAISGWTGNGSSAPIASDASGPLSNTEAVTLLTLKNISGTGFNAGIPAGFELALFYVVDDTGAKKVLYEDDDAFGGSTLAKNVGGFVEQ